MPGGKVMPRALFQLIFILFTTSFVSLIVIADRGEAGHLWSFVGRIPCGDKLGHLILVGTFSVLLNLLLEVRAAGRILLGSLLLLVAMTLEEGSQQLIPSRTPDLLDWLSNVVGIFCGEGLVRMLPRRRAAGQPAGH